MNVTAFVSSFMNVLLLSKSLLPVGSINYFALWDSFTCSKNVNFTSKRPIVNWFILIVVKRLWLNFHSFQNKTNVNVQEREKRMRANDDGVCQTHLLILYFVGCSFPLWPSLRVCFMCYSDGIYETITKKNPAYRCRKRRRKRLEKNVHLSIPWTLYNYP